MNFYYLNREVWPQSDCFGTENAQPEEDLLLLRDIFMTNLNSGEFQSNKYLWIFFVCLYVYM